MAAQKHYFVVNRQGASVHMKGAFESPAAAKEWVAINCPTRPVWLIPAEYIGPESHKPLDANGQSVQEG